MCALPPRYITFQDAANDDDDYTLTSFRSRMRLEILPAPSSVRTVRYSPTRRKSAAHGEISCNFRFTRDRERASERSGRTLDSTVSRSVISFVARCCADNNDCFTRTCNVDERSCHSVRGDGRYERLRAWFSVVVIDLAIVHGKFSEMFLGSFTFLFSTSSSSSGSSCCSRIVEISDTGARDTPVRFQT